MCGRITSKVSPQDLQEFFDVVRFDDSSDWSPRYNVAPTTQMICVKSTPDGREAFPARWGLIPSWVKDLKIATSTFNARSDTVATKSMFRSAFKARRCLVIASGFYEWKKLDAKNKQPNYITRTNGQPMAMAGLHEWWKSPEGDEIVSCTICTTEANEMMSELHDRMPVILTNDEIAPWLATSIKDVPALETLLTQFPSDEMQGFGSLERRRQPPESRRTVDFGGFGVGQLIGTITGIKKHPRVSSWMEAQSRTTDPASATTTGCGSQ